MCREPDTGTAFGETSGSSYSDSPRERDANLSFGSKHSPVGGTMCLNCVAQSPS